MGSCAHRLPLPCGPRARRGRRDGRRSSCFPWPVGAEVCQLTPLHRTARYESVKHSCVSAPARAPGPSPQPAERGVGGGGSPMSVGGEEGHQGRVRPRARNPSDLLHVAPSRTRGEGRLRAQAGSHLRARGPVHPAARIVGAAYAGTGRSAHAPPTVRARESALRSPPPTRSPLSAPCAPAPPRRRRVTCVIACCRRAPRSRRPESRAPPSASAPAPTAGRSAPKASPPPATVTNPSPRRAAGRTSAPHDVAPACPSSIETTRPSDEARRSGAEAAAGRKSSFALTSRTAAGIRAISRGPTKGAVSTGGATAPLSSARAPPPRRRRHASADR